MSRLDAGVVLGTFRIDAVLGEGGMSVVYLAHDTRLNRAVAIKFLSAELATPTERRRFQREAQTASSLNHPHIITVHDVGEFDGREYLVTELVDGGTLAEWMRGGHHTWRDAIELLLGIADALAAAHDAGILHRDVKPANVLLTRTGYAKLADFGLARVTAAPHDVTRTVTLERTAYGAIVGTVAYMSPEQASAAPLDARSDVFSFGILLYEVLAGRRPFGGATSVDVLHAIVHHRADPLPDSVPPSVRFAVDKALEKNPAERYQSMRDLLVDLRRAVRQSQELAGASGQIAAWRPWLWRIAAIAALLAGGALILWNQRQPSAPAQPEYTALTRFTDSVVAPAISGDGRILAFIRGEHTFVGPGEIFVKLLPDGEPSQLTHDRSDKMGPLAFSPDGSRIAYTTNSTSDGWSVPVLGGTPTRLMSNAGALSWIDQGAQGSRRVLFSALTGRGIHLGVFTATETRADERPVYVPADVNGMAHRSFLSPDGASVLIVEMDMLGWRPCRLVPFNGRSPGKPVGPPRSQCTDAAWSSPDGAWMYMAANTGNGFHIWRQRFPDGEPEQVTFGATEEQGIAFDPDGRSFVTSIGESRSTLWVHAGETRQVTFEGFAYMPSFSEDGNRLYYLQRTRADRRFVSGELWTIDLQTGTRERLLADSLMEHYDVSRDGRRVAFIGVDASGRSSVWEASLDGSAAPRRLSPFEGLRVLFGPQEDVFFVGGETTSLYLYRMARDGTNLRKVIATPANFLYDISPDGKWVAAWVGSSVAFHPVEGGQSIVLCPSCATAGEENRGVTPSLVRWSRDGRFLYLHSTSTRQTYALALRPGEVVPRLPPGGFPQMADAAKALGAEPIADQRAFVSSDPATYAFPRVATHRNIYRIRVQ